MGFKWRFSQITGLIEQRQGTNNSILDVEKFVIIFEPAEWMDTYYKTPVDLPPEYLLRASDTSVELIGLRRLA